MHSKKSSFVSGLFKQSWEYQQELRKESGKAKRDWATFDPKGNVYLIGNKELGFYKIGLTRSAETPDTRFKTIQRSVPFELDVLRYWFVSHAGSFEKLLHYEFKDYQIRGEWFKFSADILDQIVEQIKTLHHKATSSTSNEESTS